MTTDPLVLQRGSTQIEIHVTRNRDSGDFNVLAFAGTAAGAPTRTTGQGPFATLNAALAVQNAIADALQRDGYAICPHATPVWRFHANQQQRDITRSVTLNRPDCSFDPSQVLLDQPDDD